MAFRTNLLMVCALLMGAVTVGAAPSSFNGIAAIVNEKVITWDEVRQQAELGRLRQAFNPSVGETLLRDTLERMVETELILHEFRTSGFQMPESAVDKTLEERIRRDFGDRVNMMKTLRAQGKTLETYREEIRNEIIAGAMKRERVFSGILISPHKIETYYEEHQDDYRVDDQVKVSMIYLGNSLLRPARETRRLAEEVHGRLMSGVPFSEMASIYNDSTTFRSKGGSQGWQLHNFIPADIREAVLAMDTGQLSEVLESPESNGFYIVLLEDRRSAHVPPLAEVREEIEGRLSLEEQQRLEDDWIERLKKKSLVQYMIMNPR